MADDLVARLAEGRAEAFAALHDAHAAALFRVAWTMLRSRADAEDAVQDVFLGVVRAAASLGRVENLRAYLFGALRHAVGRIAARKEAPPVRPPPPPEPDVGLSDWLDRAVALLPAPQREVLSLKVDGGLTFDEIATALGVSPNTAASRYRYALEKLRAHFAEEHHAVRPG